MSILTLDDLCTFINGGAWSENEYVTSGHPVLKVSNIKGTSVDTDNLSFLSDASLKKYEKNILQVYDLVIATVGSHQGLIQSAAGRTIIIRKDIAGFLLNQNAVCLRTKKPELLDQKYLGYLGESEHFKNYIQVRGRGAANQMRIAVGEIKKYSPKLPNLYSQKKIAAILSAYDDLIENNLKRIKLLEEMAQITYEEWFVRLCFPGHESTPIDSATGLPEGWVIRKVDSLLAKPPISKKIRNSEIESNGLIPVVDQSRDFIAGFTDDPEALINFSLPVIVFGDHTRVIKFINFPFARGADGTQLIVSNEARMPQHLLYHALLNLGLPDYHYARHFKFLKDLEISIPTVELANKFEYFAAPVFNVIKKLRIQNQRLREARDILLPRLMTGKIDVESYNPADLLKEVA